MNLEEYKELTGKNVSQEDESFVTRQIQKNQRVLESILGFTLDPDKTQENFYNEVGKAKSDWLYPNIDTSNLLPPDEVVGAYRMYRYNNRDKYLHVDPFTAVHAVKLVYVKNGYPDENSITFKTFDADEIRVHFGRNGIGKYIEKLKEYYCGCGIDYNFVQLAVDADWAFQDCLPPELSDILAEMTSESIDPLNNVKSESIEGHSYSKYDKASIIKESSTLDILNKYAGPYGSLTRMSVTL